MTLMEAKKAGVVGFRAGLKSAIEDKPFMRAVCASEISTEDLTAAYSQGVRAAKSAGWDLNNGFTSTTSIALVNQYLAV